MKYKNKIIIYLLISMLFLVSLCACSSNTTTITENGTVDATSNITWDEDTKQIVVSTVTLKCNDAYYGVVVNDSINFNNKNNYFTTGSGLTIQITDEDISNGKSTDNDNFTYAATIEEDAHLIVSGSDEELVKSIFNNVFKTNKESYQMFSHDISKDWINSVVITSDVVSFSNGSDTTYIYQNEGSLSPGCLDGKIEPTVFKKQLRGIDIPITYPEDIEGVSNYIPYGTKTYEHWTNEGYTPYSAYTLMSDEQVEELRAELIQTTLTDEEKQAQEEQAQRAVAARQTANSTSKEEKEETTQDSTGETQIINVKGNDMTNFIILSNNDDNVLDLFEEENDHTQNLYSLSLSNKETTINTIQINTENLSDKKDIASSVINSENRYHFGILSEADTYLYPWSESNTSGYYVDDNYNISNNFKIAGEMNGKLVMPTIKLSSPTYEDTEATELHINETLKEYGTKVSESNTDDYQIYGTNLDYAYAMEGHTDNPFAPGIESHGATYSFKSLLENAGNSKFVYHYYILEGDYVYYLNNKGFYIYKNIGTNVLKQEGKATKVYTYLGVDFSWNFVNSGSCFGDSVSNLTQMYSLETKIKNNA